MGVYMSHVIGYDKKCRMICEEQSDDRKLFEDLKKKKSNTYKKYIHTNYNCCLFY